MKSLSDEIKESSPSGLFERAAKIKAEIDQHPAVLALRQTYPDREAHFNQLFHYSKYSDNCKQCPGLENCQNAPHGHQMLVADDPLNEKRHAFTFKPCDLQIAHEKQLKVQQMVKSHYIPEHILNMTFDALDHDQQRIAAIKETMAFCLNFKRGETKKGLYLHGPLGIGKSAIFGAAARELAMRNVDVLMVYVPDFLGEVKSAIKTGEVESKIDALRDVSVLILDDIGAEPLTQWTRDEVLGPVLQRRMERLPTLFTSNLTLGELKTHLGQVKDESIPNVVKASRLMDRIEPFVKVIKVGGRNRRREEK